MLPVTASATGTAPTPSPTAPSPRPTPPPPPPPPPVNHYRTHLPVGPADTGPVVAAIQQRLIWLGAPVKLTKVMDRAHPRGASRTSAGSSASPRGTTVTTTLYSKLSSVSRAHGALPAACRTTGIVLCIDKTQKSLRYVSHGKVVLTTDARFGSDALPHPRRHVPRAAQGRDARVVALPHVDALLDVLLRRPSRALLAVLPPRRLQRALARLRQHPLPSRPRGGSSPTRRSAPGSSSTARSTPASARRDLGLSASAVRDSSARAWSRYPGDHGTSRPASPW